MSGSLITEAWTVRFNLRFCCVGVHGNSKITQLKRVRKVAQATPPQSLHNRRRVEADFIAPEHANDVNNCKCMTH